MAIERMKRLALAVVRSQKQQLLEELIQHGCVQFEEIDTLVSGSEIESLVKSESSDLMNLRSTHSTLLHAVALLDKYAPVKTPMMFAKPEFESGSFLDENGLQGAIGFAEAIEKNDDRRKRISAEESRLRSVVESLKPWLDFGMPLSCDGTGYAAALMGTIPARIDLNTVDSAIAGVTEEAELYRVGEDKNSHYVALVCIRESFAAVQEVLRAYGFAVSSLTGMSGTAREELTVAQQQLKDLAAEKQQCADAIAAEAVRRDDIKLAADKMSAKISMAQAEEKLFGTESAVMMEGWVPESRESEISGVLDRYDCAYETREPKKEEYPDVPVKLKNNGFTNALNMVTNMYSLPQYGTVDPNPLMAPFFILFFGLMFADMGYGLIMIIASIIALKKIKPRDGSLSSCQLLLWAGISTLIMGALTGSFFSDIPYQLNHIINPNSTWQGLPRLFSPTEDSIMVLIGSMVLGVLHLNTGLAVNFAQKVKAGNTADAIWEEGSLWILLLSGIVFALKKFGIVPAIPAPVATWLPIAALAMLLFGSGRHAKGIFGKIGAAFGCIYNTATGWFGDILSYSRIMALMLAGGVVGQVFNTVAIMPMKSSGINALTVIAFIIIFLLGHAMNFGLNLLGCYVHDLRLQCLEFFGKFYSDGGKPFKPLEIKGKFSNTKLTDN